MGSVHSTAYNFCRRMILRYNVQNRALKFLDRERLPPAPKHPLPPTLGPKENAQDPSLKEIHNKSEELTGYLKKVYLTSTSEVTGTPSKRPLPKKENERYRTTMFYEPETPAPGHITLSKLIDVLYKTQDESKFLTPSAIAKEYNLDKKDTSYLIAYYSLFRLEKFDFMNAVEKEDPKKEELQTIESSELKKTPRRITAK